MKLRCVQCGHGVEKLYIQYSPGNIRLVKCDSCNSVADEYIECELMILIIDLILHKPKAYRHLLFNLLNRKSLDTNALLYKVSLIFLLLDAYKIWILSGKTQEWSFCMISKILACAIFGNLVFSCVLFECCRRVLDFVEGFHRYEDVLLAMVVSSYMKIYMLAMVVWEFPVSAVYIVDLAVISSNLIALGVISKSSSSKCAMVCFGAHVLKLLVHLVFQEFSYCN